MTEEQRYERNAQRLTECNPIFRRKVAAILADLEGHGWRPRIQEAWRSPARQKQLLDDDQPNHESTKFLLMLASSAKAHGCVTGIDWGLAQEDRDTIRSAIASRDFDAKIEVGWDPCHVQIVRPQLGNAAELTTAPNDLEKPMWCQRCASSIGATLREKERGLLAAIIEAKVVRQRLLLPFPRTRKLQLSRSRSRNLMPQTSEAPSPVSRIREMRISLARILGALERRRRASRVTGAASDRSFIADEADNKLMILRLIFS